jgi:hypothetical protein
VSRLETTVQASALGRLEATNMSAIVVVAQLLGAYTLLAMIARTGTSQLLA